MSHEGWSGITEKQYRDICDWIEHCDYCEACNFLDVKRSGDKLEIRCKACFRVTTLWPADEVLKRCEGYYDIDPDDPENND